MLSILVHEPIFVQLIHASLEMNWTKIMTLNKLSNNCKFKIEECKEDEQEEDEENEEREESH